MADFTNNSLKPVHNNLQPLGTDSTHAADVPLYSQSLTAFTALSSSASGSTHDTFRTSGYIYVNTANSSLTKRFDDYIRCADNLINIPVYFSDTADTTDSLYVFQSLIKTFEDVGDSTDSLVSGSVFGEGMPSTDSLVKLYVKTFEDVIRAADTQVGFEPFDGYCTVTIGNQQLSDSTGTVVISVDGLEDASSLINVTVIQDSLALVTSLTSVSNPFQPTVIVGGTTYVTNACTAPPPGYDPGATWVQYLNAAIGSTDFCSLTGSNLNLDYSGGTFTIASKYPLGVSPLYTGNLGRTISAYGLNGTITDFGKTITSSENSYISSGIFGTPAMSKPFNLITYGQTQYFTFLASQNSLTLAPQINSYTTIKGMAQAIASNCGIVLSWLIPDAPYRDIFRESGLTGLEALSTLAGQMGGQVRWNGGDYYIVAYPTYTTGSWYVPNSKLLNASGMKFNNHLDLGYGVSGSGVLGLPTNLFFNQPVKTIPDTVNSTPTEDIQKIATVTKAFTIDDPTLIVDLPNDIVSVKIQILITSSIGAQYTTNDPSVWFDLGSPGIGNPYVKIVKVGNSYVNQLHANYTLFPSLAAIDNGNFVMSFGIVRRSMSPQFDKAQQDADLLRRELQAKILANVKFIKTYSGTISCQFFGSMPLPGMFASAEYCDETVQGIVESVSLSGNGILTVEVAQYFRINLLDRKLDFDLLNGNYDNV